MRGQNTRHGVQEVDCNESKLSLNVQFICETGTGGGWGLSMTSTSEQVLRADGLDGKVWDEEKLLACLAAAADEPLIISDVT